MFQEHRCLRSLHSDKSPLSERSSEVWTQEMSYPRLPSLHSLHHPAVLPQHQLHPGDLRGPGRGGPRPLDIPGHLPGQQLGHGDGQQELWSLLGNEPVIDVLGYFQRNNVVVRLIISDFQGVMLPTTF